MKILIVTYHTGCIAVVKSVCRELGHELSVQHADWNYSIGASRACELWNKHNQYYSQFDLIITADTAPLSRIFLQAGYTGKLLVWVCNRFDYCDEISRDCEFPDQMYFGLIKEAIRRKKNVKIRSYTEFEHIYANCQYQINWPFEPILKPYIFDEIKKPENFQSLIPENINKAETFFIPNYHNDTLLVDICSEMNIPHYRGKYFGVYDLIDFKAIIHIPYAWSNIALFENWKAGNVYIIPSKEFLFNIMSQVPSGFFWSPPFWTGYIEKSEWYNPVHKDLFLYFDNWNELHTFAKNPDIIEAKKQTIKDFYTKQSEIELSKWKNEIEHW